MKIDQSIQKPNSQTTLLFKCFLKDFMESIKANPNKLLELVEQGKMSKMNQYFKEDNGFCLQMEDIRCLYNEALSNMGFIPSPS